MFTNISQAKSNLSRLVAMANNGEDVIIGKSGKPIARLVPYNTKDFIFHDGKIPRHTPAEPDLDVLLSDLIKGFPEEL